MEFIQVYSPELPFLSHDNKLQAQQELNWLSGMGIIYGFDVHTHTHCEICSKSRKQQLQSPIHSL
jgi:hypothetical protein